MQEQVQTDKKTKETKSKKNTVNWEEIITHFVIKAAEGLVTGIALGVAGLTINSISKNYKSKIDSDDLLCASENKTSSI